jgi:hypothetical protein
MHDGHVESGQHDHPGQLQVAETSRTGVRHDVRGAIGTEQRVLPYSIEMLQGRHGGRRQVRAGRRQSRRCDMRVPARRTGKTGPERDQQPSQHDAHADEYRRKAATVGGIHGVAALR